MAERVVCSQCGFEWDSPPAEAPVEYRCPRCAAPALPQWRLSIETAGQRQHFIGCGTGLLAVGLLCGGSWTLLTHSLARRGVSGTIALVSTLLVVCAALTYLLAARFPAADLLAGGKKVVSAAMALLFLAVVGYLFAFAVCSRGF